MYLFAAKFHGILFLINQYFLSLRTDSLLCLFERGQIVSVRNNRRHVKFEEVTFVLVSIGT